MNFLTHIPFLELGITGFALVGIVLPAAGLIVAVVPYLLAVLIALIRRDPNGPFVPHSHVVGSRVIGATCLGVGLVALLAVQPRYFRVASAAPVEPAPEDAALHRLIAPDVTPLVESAPCLGVVVGIVEPSGSHVLGFGRSSLDRSAPPDGASVFEVGAVTQVFTASLLAQAVEEGKVRMDQTVQSLLPDSVSVPILEDHLIELRHLASYSSGLPRLDSRRAFPRLTLFPPFSRAGSAYSKTWLYNLISSTVISSHPGTRFDGSDLGMGLLGHVLELATETQYEALLQREICEPLGMKDTRVKLTPAMRERLSPGLIMGWGAYRGWRVASPTRRWLGGTLPGATDVCTTANDLMAFLRVHLGMAPSPLAAVLAETRRARYRVPGRSSIGLGWFISTSEASEPIAWQHGSAGACRSYVAFMETRGIGVVVLANTPIDVERLGSTILNRLATQQLNAAIPRPEDAAGSS